MGHFRVVLQTFKNHQLFSKYRKCECWLRSVAFLDHIISSKGIEFDPRKIEVVRSCPRPLTPTHIKSFLGLEGFYRRFMDGFVSIEFTLTTLNQKSKKFEWLEACEKSFQILRDRLTFALVLTLPEGTKGFVVYCDASQVGFGCLIMQHRKVDCLCF